MKYFVLKGKTPVAESDEYKFWVWFETTNRVVKKQTFLVNGEEVTISTVFLGVDHGYGDTPILFETLVFGGKFNDEMYRTPTWDEAEKCHENAVDMVLRNWDK